MQRGLINTLYTAMNGCGGSEVVFPFFFRDFRIPSLLPTKCRDLLCFIGLLLHRLNARGSYAQDGRYA